MGRIDLLPKNELVRRVSALTRLRDQLKAKQIFGSDSVRTARVYTADAYDIEVTDVQFNNRVVLVTLTPDDTTYGESALAYSIHVEGTAAANPNSVVDLFVERDVPANGVQQWKIYLQGSDFYPTSWVRLKFYFYATGSGQISASLI